MSHEFESGFQVREPAWHRLGVVLDDPPSVEEAIRVAGLDWRVLELPLHAEVVDESGIGRIDIPSHKLLVRDRDRSVLGVVGDAYVPYQNADALGWFQPLVADGTVHLECAGSLMGGRKVWVLGRYADPVEVVPGDAMVPYVLLSTGHDGAQSVRVKNTPVRVVCWNTLQFAGVGDDADAEVAFSAKGGASFSHVGDVSRRVERARQWVVAARQGVEATRALYRAMAGKAVDVATLRTFAREVFDSDYVEAVALLKRLRTRLAAEERAEEAETREKLRAKVAEIEELVAKPTRIEGQIAELFESGPGHELAGATAWGALNAATAYIDHVRGRTEERRLSESWFGAGASLRRRATELAKAML